MAVTVGLTLADRLGRPGWKAAASAAGLLSALVLFSLLDSLVIQRPWDRVLERRARRRSAARQEAETEESLLDRIRCFFKLGPTDT